MAPEARILIGDCRETLASLPAGSVHCAMTSPPYFALRSYLPDDHPDKASEIGSEPTPEAFLATMVEVFRGVRRVLRDDGVLFVNLGDSYADDSKWGGSTGGKHVKGLHGQTGVGRARRRLDCDPKRGEAAEGQPKRKTEGGQLGNIPHRFAEALRADGWIWRQTIIWGKKSPMPESVGGWRWVRCRVKVAAGWSAETHPSTTGRSGVFACDGTSPGRPSAAKWSPCPGCDRCTPNGGWVLRRGKGRCTTAHEYVFVFSKSATYFWDSEASKEKAVSTHPPGNKRMPVGTPDEMGGSYYRRTLGKVNGALSGAVTERNPRTVWMLSSEPTSEKHFATFPSELVRRCLVAGVSAGGCCPHCGSPWAPMIETERVATRPGTNSKVNRVGIHEETYHDHAGVICGNRDPQRHNSQSRCLGYRQTCSCPAHEAVPCTVLDPFSGLATTGQTAVFLGHNYIGCELNPEYAEISRKRMHKPPRWWLRKQKPKTNGTKPLKAQLPLF